MTEKNQELYNSGAILDWYKNQHGLMTAETEVFNELKDLLPGFTVLDIGIGSGRTTAFLSKICRSYTGIDYSSALINFATATYPEADLRLMDARDLSGFKNATFDLVTFSFNGIDYVPLNDRLKVMTEVFRVLKPGGIFFFSSHNKAHASFNRAPWLNREASMFINLKTFLSLLPFLPRHLARKKHEQVNSDYALINDCAHSYGLMTFYTTPPFLKEQLKQAGFVNVKLRAHSGKKVEDQRLESWIFATCQSSAL